MATVTELQFGKYETVQQDDYLSKFYIDFQSERLKMLSYQGNVEKVARNAIAICGKYGLGKILATVHEEDKQVFLQNGFVNEAIIEGYFIGKAGYNVSYFYDPERAISHKTKDEDEIVENARKNKGQYQRLNDSMFTIRTANLDDAEELARLYDLVFKTYPTPVHKEKYIQHVMGNNKVFFMLAEYNNEIVSASSADLNHEFLNAEITDCATHPEHRGKGLLSELVYELENALRDRSYHVLYSIARAISPGVNIVFSKHGYTYSGRQVNNSNIMGKFEDMNIWVKNIRTEKHNSKGKTDAIGSQCAV
jgi:putative beta-lysine N-acetyltransferase